MAACELFISNSGSLSRNKSLTRERVLHIFIARSIQLIYTDRLELLNCGHLQQDSRLTIQIVSFEVAPAMTGHFKLNFSNCCIPPLSSDLFACENKL